MLFQSEKAFDHHVSEICSELNNTQVKFDRGLLDNIADVLYFCPILPESSNNLRQSH